MRTIYPYLLCVLATGHVISIRYDNITVDPASRQLLDFKLENPVPIGLMTTSAGEPVEIRNTIALNTNQFTNQYHLDLHLNFDAERIPERVVHAKGTAAHGYLEITNDVTRYCSAELFNRIGKRTQLVVRFSSAIQSLGGNDLSRELKGMSVKFYTNEGNLDLLGINIPVYFYKDPILFHSFVHAFKRNPRTQLHDFTMRWDLLTLKPEIIHAFFWLLADYGIPNGYRRMDGFPIHAYELHNKHGERFYVRFNFRTELGVAGLTTAQAAAISGVDLDYANRDLYNAIEQNNFPTWRMEMDVMTLEDIKNIDYDPFDETRLWKNGTYKTVQIGRIVLNRNPDNAFRVSEQSAFNPGNLVPGIPGPVDILFNGRRVFYRDTQNHRLGTNHNNILVNLPKYAKTYNRDGNPPVKDNMRDMPNYYPNSFSGPIPYVDESRPNEKLQVMQSNAVDLEMLTEFYNTVLENDAHRQRFIENIVQSLVPVTPPVSERVLKLMYLIDLDLGTRVNVGLNAALFAARATQDPSTNTTRQMKN